MPEALFTEVAMDLAIGFSFALAAAAILILCGYRSSCRTASAYQKQRESFADANIIRLYAVVHDFIRRLYSKAIRVRETLNVEKDQARMGVLAGQQIACANMLLLLEKLHDSSEELPKDMEAVMQEVAATTQSMLTWQQRKSRGAARLKLSGN